MQEVKDSKNQQTANHLSLQSYTSIKISSDNTVSLPQIWEIAAEI